MAYETSDGITALEGLEAVRRRSARLRARPHRSGAFAEHNEAWTVGIGVQMEHPQEQRTFERNLLGQEEPGNAVLDEYGLHPTFRGAHLDAA